MTALNIYQRLAAVMGEITYIQKERKTGMQYTIVSHDAVTAKVRPALLRHGIVYFPVRCEYAHNGNRAECAMTVRFVNIDEPGDFFDVPSFGYGIDPQDKGPGKAMSYAVKYALLKALGLETGDDPDQDSIPHSREDPAVPAFVPEAAAQRIKERIQKAGTYAALVEVWSQEKDTVLRIGEANRDLGRSCYEARDARRAQLDPALQAPGEAA